MRPKKPDIRWLLAVLFLTATAAGLALGEAQAVLAYAWPLCLPCIGIQ